MSAYCPVLRFGCPGDLGCVGSSCSLQEILHILRRAYVAGANSNPPTSCSLEEGDRAGVKKMFCDLCHKRMWAEDFVYWSTDGEQGFCSESCRAGRKEKAP